MKQTNARFDDLRPWWKLGHSGSTDGGKKLGVLIISIIKKATGITLSTTVGQFSRDLHFEKVYMAWPTSSSFFFFSLICCGLLSRDHETGPCRPSKTGVTSVTRSDKRGHKVSVWSLCGWLGVKKTNNQSINLVTLSYRYRQDVQSSFNMTSVSTLCITPEWSYGPLT